MIIMIKKISILALSILAISVAGCGNQASSSSDNDKPKTEQTKKKKTPAKPKTDTTTENDTKTDTNTDNNTQQNNDNNNTNTTPAVNITNGDDAVKYLLGKLTIDKTGLSALYNGTVTDNNGASAYLINLYHQGEGAPFSQYRVYSNGVYTQVW